MSEKELRDSKYVENFNPPWIVEQLVHKVRKSVADAFLEHIEYGKDYVIKTKMAEDDWEDGFGTRYIYNLKYDELVRCKDCKYCHKNYCEKRISPTVSPSEIFWIPVEPDGYCKWGERRES